MEIRCKGCGTIFNSRKDNSFCYTCRRIRKSIMGMDTVELQRKKGYKKSKSSMYRITDYAKKAKELGMSYGEYVAKLNDEK